MWRSSTRADTGSLGSTKSISDQAILQGAQEAGSGREAQTQEVRQGPGPSFGALSTKSGGTSERDCWNPRLALDLVAWKVPVPLRNARLRPRSQKGSTPSAAAFGSRGLRTRDVCTRVRRSSTNATKESFSFPAALPLYLPSTRYLALLDPTSCPRNTDVTLRTLPQTVVAFEV